MSRRCKEKHRFAFGVGFDWVWCPDCGAIRCVGGRPWPGWVYPNGREKTPREFFKMVERARNA